MPRREFGVGAHVLPDGSPHLTDSRVELVDGGDDEGFDRFGFDRGTVLTAAVMGHDQMLNLRAQVVGEA